MGLSADFSGATPVAAIELSFAAASVVADALVLPMALYGYLQRQHLWRRSAKLPVWADMTHLRQGVHRYLERQVVAVRDGLPAATAGASGREMAGLSALAAKVTREVGNSEPFTYRPSNPRLTVPVDVDDAERMLAVLQTPLRPRDLWEVGAAGTAGGLLIHERALVVVNAERGVEEPSHAADYRIDLAIRVSDLSSPAPSRMTFRPCGKRKRLSCPTSSEWSADVAASSKRSAASVMAGALRRSSAAANLGLSWG